MTPVGTKTEATKRAMDRLGLIDSKSFAPTPDAKVDALAGALDWYDKIRPRAALYQVAGNGTKRRFVLSTDVTGWKKGSSEVLNVHLVTAPDTDDEVATEVNFNDWDQRQNAAGDDCLYLGAPVDTGTTLQVTWNAPHVVSAGDAGDTTIPDKDADSFTSMFASFLARWISRRASDAANANLGADQVDAEPISERWARRAKELAQQAMERVAPTEQSVAAAGASLEWEDATQLTRRPRIGH